MTSAQKYLTRKAVKAGTRWTARHAVVRTADRMRPGRRIGGVPGTIAFIAFGMALGAGLARLLDPRRRAERRQAVQHMSAAARARTHEAAVAGRRAAHSAQGAAAKATAPIRDARKEQPDDATLARKVETAIFRAPDAPKGKVDVNAEGGVVYLRGEVGSADLIGRLVSEAEAVQGVRAVQSLLHLPGAPAPTKDTVRH